MIQQNTTTQAKKLLTLKELAERLNVSKQCVYRSYNHWASEGLRVVRIGLPNNRGTLRFDASSVEEFLKRCGI